jgi:transposase-like protein
VESGESVPLRVFEDAQVPRKGYPPQFCRRAVELLRSGSPVAEVARLLEVSEASLYVWRRQDRIDRREVAGVSSTEHAEPAVARRRIAELEAELAIHHRAAALLKVVVPPTGTWK